MKKNKGDLNENNLPFGLAIMLVRGNTSDLKDALTKLDLLNILFYEANLQKSLLSYNKSKKDAPDNSVTSTLLSIGEYSVLSAKNALKTSMKIISTNRIIRKTSHIIH